MEKVADLSPGNTYRPSWSQFANRFSSASDCLAAFIALETAEVLAGAKPSVLISLQDRPRVCGLNLYRFWRERGSEIIAQTCLSVREIGKGSDFVQLFFYIADNFSDFLKRRDVTTLLHKAGYEGPFTIDHALDQLENRLKTEAFPHEIGIFLGYPVKDVAAFMGWIKLPFACQGPWKMFGNPGASLKLAETFRTCRRSMAEKLTTTQSALDCIVPSVSSRQSLFLSAK